MMINNDRTPIADLSNKVPLVSSPAGLLSVLASQTQ